MSNQFYVTSYPGPWRRLRLRCVGVGVTDLFLDTFLDQPIEAFRDLRVCIDGFRDGIAEQCRNQRKGGGTHFFENEHRSKKGKEKQEQ